MRKLLTVQAAACCAAFLAIAGCTAEQTQEGRPPDVDVDVEPGRMPRYDVEWADVDVGTTERTVTVPVVRIEEEERQVTVPYLDINPPGGRDREERTITMEVDVPHAEHALQIREVRAAGDTLWVIAQLRETGEARTREKVRVSDQVVVNAPEDLNVRKVVVGERPEGTYNRQYRFVDSMAALEQRMPQDGRVIYQRDVAQPETGPEGG